MKIPAEWQEIKTADRLAISCAMLIMLFVALRQQLRPLKISPCIVKNWMAGARINVIAANDIGLQQRRQIATEIDNIMISRVLFLGFT
ncbi:MAG: hypothetical protein HYR68_15055 [Burkholderiales bacterium]|nr:hypothetical protein [Burkholderiales bacterium]MBI3728284.1 hypothetical protein [Burkholderiales bacterium]